MGALESLLRDADANVRVAAVESIGELGAFAVDPASALLLRCLDAEETHIRLAALEGLNRLGVVVPWEKLGPLVSHRILRRAALTAASRVGRVEAASALAKALEDESSAIFRLGLLGLAELALGRDIAKRAWKDALPALGNKSRERLLQALAADGEDEAARRAALVVAALVGEGSAIDLTIDALIDDRVAREADAALLLFGGAAVPRILARWSTETLSSERRRSAAWSICARKATRMPFAWRSAERSLTRRPTSPRRRSWPLASWAARKTSPRCSPPWPGKSSKALASAQSALTALSRRFPEDARMIARVARRDAASQMATSVIIGALRGDVLGTVADDVAFLATALSSADPETRLTAVEAVAEVGSDLGMETIQFALADEEREIQLAAVRALGRLKTSDGSSAGGDRLVEIVRGSNDPEIVAAAARALGEAGDARARENRSARWLFPIRRWSPSRPSRPWAS